MAPIVASGRTLEVHLRVYECKISEPGARFSVMQAQVSDTDGGLLKHARSIRKDIEPDAVYNVEGIIGLEFASSLGFESVKLGGH